MKTNVECVLVPKCWLKMRASQAPLLTQVSAQPQIRVRPGPEGTRGRAPPARLAALQGPKHIKDGGRRGRGARGSGGKEPRCGPARWGRVPTRARGPRRCRRRLSPPRGALWESKRGALPCFALTENHATFPGDAWDSSLSRLGGSPAASFLTPREPLGVPRGALLALRATASRLPFSWLF